MTMEFHQVSKSQIRTMTKSLGDDSNLGPRPQVKAQRVGAIDSGH